MARMSVREIDQAHAEDWTEQDQEMEIEANWYGLNELADVHLEAHADEQVEPPYDPRDDAWWFDDYYDAGD